MLETVRAYAMLELTASGERDEVMEDLVRYCTEQSNLAMDALAGPQQLEWLHRVRGNLECIRSVLAWLLERGRSEEASVVASGVAFFWLIRGHAVEGLQWYEQILSRPPLSTRGEARMLMGAALMCYSQGHLGRAREALTRSVALARDAEDWYLVAQAEHLFGHAELAVGDNAAATARFTSSVDRFRTLGIPWGIGATLTGMAWVALSEGDIPRVERLLHEATAVLRDAGPWFMALVRYLRAILAMHRGDADAAIASMRESLVNIRDVQDKFAFVYALVPLSAAAILKGNDEWAARLLGARDAVTERTGATVVDKAAHAMRAQTERDVRARLGPERWAAAYAAGREASIDTLVKEIDSLA
jgi:tetratricopeptide (TPR) repeat protein